MKRVCPKVGNRSRTAEGNDPTLRKSNIEVRRKVPPAGRQKSEGVGSRKLEVGSEMVRLLTDIGYIYFTVQGTPVCRGGCTDRATKTYET